MKTELTAMQLMAEWLDTVRVDYSEISTESAFKYATELLEKEKQQMKAIYLDPISGVDETDFEFYYNETFKP